jgi:hypothetical protein
VYRLPTAFGYLALLATPAALLGAALARSPPPSAVDDAGIAGVGVNGTPAVTGTPAVIALAGVAALAGSVVVRAEGERLLTVADEPGYGFEFDDAADVVAVPAAAVLTYVLNVQAGLGPVIASALVGLLAGLALRRVDASAYCGSFVGMASAQVFPTVEYVVLAGALAGVAYVATDDCFAGLGGKLGTLALFGCASVVAVTGTGFGSADPVSPTQAWLVVPVAAAGAVATVVASLRLGWGPVVGSAAVGLAAGVALPLLAPAGETLAAVAFCASFVGMSSADRLRSEAHVALAGAVCGLVFVAVSSAFVGAGGKLGTVAFVACLAVAGAERLRRD